MQELPAQSMKDRSAVEPLIELINVSKRFEMHRERQRSWQETFISLVQRKSQERHEHFWPLRDVSFEVYPGDSVGILGPNGSGKSTLLKLVTGILVPTSGTVRVNAQVASLLELGAGFHPELTGRENIFLNGSVYGISRKDMQRRMKSIIDFAELGDFIDTPVKHYSSGMYVRLGFAVAIHTDPEVLIVDEVLTVGDQLFQQKCMERIYAMKRKGVAIVLVSHNLADVQRLCNRALWLQDGEVREDGKSNDVVDEYVAFTNKRYYDQKRARDAAEAAEAEAESDGDEVGDQDESSAPVPNTQRWGNFQAEITQVELLDDDGRTPDFFLTGRGMTLRIHYKAVEPLERPAFGLAIYRRDGVHINGPNSVQAGLDVPVLDGVGYVEYAIDTLPLHPGYYELTVAIYNEDSTIPVDHQHRMYQFEVKTPNFRRAEGVVHIPATWRHVPQADNGVGPAHVSDLETVLRR